MKNHLLLLLGMVALGSCDAAPDADTEDLELGLAAGAAPGASTIWRPKTGATWDWQLTTPVDTGARVDIYDVDLFTATPALIAQLHRLGRKVVCYINVGAWEQWRPDAAKFPASILGKAWSATRFTDEKWLDIRRTDLLTPILGERFDMAKSKGCDAIEPDNIDGYDDRASPLADRTGFNLTYEDQLRFNRWVAAEAHRRGMAVALKNDPAQAKDLEPDFDFVVSEQCVDYNECGAYKPFADKNKAILLAEYREDLGIGYKAKFEGMCPGASAMGISAILKKNALDAWMLACSGTGIDAATPRGPGRIGLDDGIDAGRGPGIVRPRDAGAAATDPRRGRLPWPARTPDAGQAVSAGRDGERTADAEQAPRAPVAPAAGGALGGRTAGSGRSPGIGIWGGRGATRPDAGRASP